MKSTIKAMDVFREVFLSASMPRWKRFLTSRRVNQTGASPLTCYNAFLSFLALCDITLRGISQVFLCDNPVSGLFICAGLACTSPELLAYALIGTVCGTAGAALLATAPAKDIAAGLCGYDGALVGCACWACFEPTLMIPNVASNHTHTLPKMVAAVLLSFLAGIVHVGLSNVLFQFALPTFTFAFNVVTISFLISTATGLSTSLTLSSLPPPSQPPLPLPLTASFFFESSVKGVGQFMFADTIIGSCLIIIGIAVSSRRGALFAWIGASVGCLTGFYLIALPPSRLTALRTGLYGYNSSGACASIGGGVFFDVGMGTSLLAIVGAMLSVLLQVAFESFFSHLYGVSILTFPFIVSTWIILVTRASHFTKKNPQISKKSRKPQSSFLSATRNSKDDVNMNTEKDYSVLELGLLNRKKGMLENGQTSRSSSSSSSSSRNKMNDDSLENDDNYEDESDYDAYVGYNAFIDTVNFIVASVTRHWLTMQATADGGYNETQLHTSEKSKDCLMNYPSPRIESLHPNLYLYSSTNQGFDNNHYNDAIQREIFQEYPSSSHFQSSSSSSSSSNINADGMGFLLRNTSNNDFEDNCNENENEDVEDHCSLLLPRVGSTTSIRSMSSVSSTGENHTTYSNHRPLSRLPSLASMSQALSASMPLPPPSSSPSSSSTFMKRISSMTNMAHQQSKIGIDVPSTEELEAQILRFGSRSRTSTL